jgi:tripartite ATP-independent transporter DctM subunit
VASITLFGLFFFLMAIGFPVAFAMAIPALLFLTFKLHVSSALMPTIFVGAVDKWTWIAIPLFIFLGNLMSNTGITNRLIRVAQALVGHIPGALSHVTVLVHLMLAGMSGSMVGDSAAVGSFMIPAMKEEGYPPSYAAAICAAGALLGPLIPPSIAAIIIGTAGDISILRIWLGGVFPALILTVFLILVGYFISRGRNYRTARRASAKEASMEILAALPALLTPIIFVGGMRMGFFTATEAAAIGIGYIIFLAIVVYKGAKFKAFYKSSLSSVKASVPVLFVIATAGLFSWVLTTLQTNQKLSELIISLSSNPIIFLYLMSFFLLIMGCVIEGAPLMLVLVPLFVPTVEKLGIDLIHFGVLFEVCTLIGQLTPPMGISMFAVCQISGVSIPDYTKRILPFLFVAILLLVLIIHFPQLTTWLPNLVLGKAP